MISLRKSARSIKRIALLLLFSFVLQIVSPTISFALTSGPTQPEFTSFEPVSTNNMVDLFTGDFTYNIPVLTVPGPNGSSYPISLSYHSGTTMEQEASWVGYGWTLNAGAITRNKRGFPDDWDGKQVKYHNKTRASHTVTVGIGTGDPELFGTSISLNLNASKRFNNYTGQGYSVGIDVGLLDGVTTLGYGISDGSGSFSLRVNPAAILSHAQKAKARKLDKAAKKMSDEGESPIYLPGVGAVKIKNSIIKAAAQNYANSAKANVAQTRFGGIDLASFGHQQMASSFRKYTGGFTRFSFGLQTDTPVPIGVEAANFFGAYAYQKTEEKSAYDVYGYYYTNETDNNETSQMDYYVDKEVNYDKKTKYIGSPVSNIDIYSVSGEGVAGGFKAHNSGVVHYRPTKEISDSQQGSGSVDVHLGGDAGVGWSVGRGYHRLTHQAWIEDQGRNVGFDPAFRFSGDFGGFITFENEAVREQFELEKVNGTPGLKKFDPDGSHFSDTYTGNEGKSNFIGYNTFGQIKSASSLNAEVNAYDKDYSEYNINYNESELQRQFAEFSITKDNGAMYNYGLPVFSRNEKILSVSVLDNADYDSDYIIHQSIFNSSGDLKENDLATIVGHEADEAYATQYLLTSILSPDYIDRTNDGPTDDDFGGWTKFEYNQIYGSANKNDQNADWYQWRMPYTGFNLQKNSLTDRDDDLASYMEGEKEIYYLDVIRTKTHVAKFVLEDRSDAFEADENSNNAGNVDGSMGSQGLKKLSKILLFTVEEYENYLINANQAQPLQVVNFGYDYSLCKGVPNNDGTQTDDGKLTLKKMWIDYEGVYEAKLSPYEFVYEYPDFTQYPAKYKDPLSLDNVTETILAMKDEEANAGVSFENPDYDVHGLDAWGYYQQNGNVRNAAYQSWLDQKQTESVFDPAAWQLKQIILPSGGEIHVQYEQDRYAYVQDEPACAMLRIDDTYSNSVDGTNYFIVHPTDLGLQSNDITPYISYLNNYFAGRKIYFKFLYNLETSSAPGIGDCDGEYISGYAEVADVIQDPSDPDAIKITIQGGGDHDTPKELCLDFWKHNRRGKVISSNCVGTAYSDESWGEEEIIQVAENLLNPLVELPAGVCQTLNAEYSYLRLPVYKSKRGGGLRVKRLMMFTSASELNGVSELYGTEYIYEDAHGFSYGVATNEPEAIREENGLVQYLADKVLSGWDEFQDKLVGGRDLDQFEGPLGEGYLPGPSVGYSKVITRNIHSGKTNTGFAINDFFTAKDYPFTASFTSIDSRKDYLPLPLAYFNSFTNNAWLTQGYVYKMYNMHGKPRKTASYAGDYHDYSSGVSPFYDPSRRTLIASTEHVYFSPHSGIPVMTDLGTVENMPMGREVEVLDYNKRLHDELYSASLAYDVTTSLTIPPLLFGTFFPSVTISETDLYNHVSVKVVNYPVVQKSTKTYVDGVYSTSENIAFDPKNGRPLITKSYDGYNDFSNSTPEALDIAGVSTDHEGIYMSYNLPGWLYYDNLDQKAKGEGKYFDLDGGSVSGELSNDILTLTPTTTPVGGVFCDLLGSLSTGDLLRVSVVSGGQNLHEYYHISSIAGNELTLQPTYYTPGAANSGTVDGFKIIRSGATNQTSMDVGSFTTYGAEALGLTSSSPNPTADQLTFLAALENASENSTYFVGPIGNNTIQTPATDCGTYEYQISFDFDSDAEVLTANFFVPSNYTNTEERFDCNLSLYGDPAVYEFFADYETGEIFYGDPSGCFAQKIDCFSFCDQFAESKTLENVVASAALTMSDEWGYDPSSYNYESGIDFSNYNFNDFELGKRGKWRVRDVYQFKQTAEGILSPVDYTTEPINDDANKRSAYNAGTYSLELFNYDNPQFNSDKWLRVSHVTQYSPNGNALEEENILGIRSSAKYGYDKSLPYLVANNSGYDKVLFESFEKVYTSGFSTNQYFEDGISVDGNVTIANVAHSGVSSARVTTSGNVISSHGVAIDAQLTANNMQFRLWVKDATNADDFSVVTNSTSSPHTEPFKNIARSGEWKLIEAIYPCSNIAGETVVFTVEYSGALPVYVDDVRMQPYNAEMATYVYDTDNLRLLASFDDQHFATFFQYNLKGQLVRKLIETEKGIRTITEQQYNTPKKDRTDVNNL